MTTLSVRIASSSTRTAVSARSSVQKCSVRRLHARQPLPYPIEGGLGEFLPPKALHTVAVEYQQGLLDRLNDEVRGTAAEEKSVAQTVIDTAPWRNATLAFNYSSLALNNSFYLNQLYPPPAEGPANHEKDIDFTLLSKIRTQYSSLEEFKSQFSAATLGLSAGGWVWFVTDPRGNLAILPTHGAGTLLVRAKTFQFDDQELAVNYEWRKEDKASVDELIESAADLYPDPRGGKPFSRDSPPGVAPSSPASGLSSSTSSPFPPHPSFGSRSFHLSAASQLSSSPTLNMVASRANSDMSMLTGKIASIGDSGTRQAAIHPGKVQMLNTGTPLFPLFCVSVFEHNWLSAGYGVWGKEEWMKRFWDVLYWPKINKTWKMLETEKGFSL